MINLSYQSICLFFFFFKNKMLFQLLAINKNGAQKIFFLNDTHQNLFTVFLLSLKHTLRVRVQG